MSHKVALLATILSALLLASPLLAADYVWTTEAVDATRFIEADSKVVGNISAGERVEVLFREGERIRVKLPESSSFGWIDAAKATENDPGSEPAVPGGDAAQPPGEAPAE